MAVLLLLLLSGSCCRCAALASVFSVVVQRGATDIVVGSYSRGCHCWKLLVGQLRPSFPPFGRR